MSNLEKCPKCQSTKIIPSVRIIDRGDYNIKHNLTVHVYDDSQLFRYTIHGELKAWICGGCGYVETYVDNPGELYTAHQQSLSQDK